ETNAREAYQDIYQKFELRKRGIENIDDFINTYFRHNDRLWDLYRKGEIEKDILRSLRFELTLIDFGINDKVLSEEIGLDYITISPQKTNLFPNAHKILDYLFPKYPMSIITNGFEEVQFTKLKNSKLDKYFDVVITSEEAGCKKPEPGIFEFALKKAGAKASDCLMIGDDPEVDIRGAANAGIDGIFFNPKKLDLNGAVKHQIFNLIELKTIL
ncbi:MAG: YjjG family noncanonical pyrimidine nucleotidase, partial [Bacteroidales bacterium]|nr:YjjG family noncanonical pyrimidine nucleotidase [Bacteroidales bacterium]